MDAVRPWRREIAAAIRGANSLAQSRASLERWAEKNAGFPPLAQLLDESLMRAWMAGRMFVHDYELRARGILLSQRKLDTSVGLETSLLGMPYDEAVRLFRARQIVTPDRFRAQEETARRGSFMATRLTTEALLEAAQSQLTTHIEQGGTFADFAAAIESADNSLGISDTSHGYLRTVFNTNVASAYGTGRLEELSTPLAIEALPYRQYRAIDDARVRPDHLALDGKIWLATDPEWMRFAPPISWNCRCAVVAVETAEEAGGDIETMLSQVAVMPEDSFKV